MNNFKYSLGDVVKINKQIDIFTHPCNDIKKYHFHTNCYYDIKEEEYYNKIGTIIENYYVSSTYNFGNTIWLYKKFKYKNWYLILVGNKNYWVAEDIIEAI